MEIHESGAQLFGFAEGDRISLKNLLYATVIYSANDGALALAQHLAGGEEGFVELMNEKAEALGATHTHFTNPHGLTSEEHYTTAYDLYLMFNAALQYPEFLEMIRTDKMTVEYTAADGSLTSKDIITTNRFLTENYSFDDGIEIVGGKTGSTNAAGKCIILYARSLYCCGNGGRGFGRTLSDSEAAHRGYTFYKLKDRFFYVRCFFLLEYTKDIGYNQIIIMKAEVWTNDTADRRK